MKRLTSQGQRTQDRGVPFHRQEFHWCRSHTEKSSSWDRGPGNLASRRPSQLHRHHSHDYTQDSFTTAQTISLRLFSFHFIYFTFLPLCLTSAQLLTATIIFICYLEALHEADNDAVHWLQNTATKAFAKWNLLTKIISFIITQQKWYTTIHFLVNTHSLSKKSTSDN